MSMGARQCVFVVSVIMDVKPTVTLGGWYVCIHIFSLIRVFKYHRLFLIHFPLYSSSSSLPPILLFRIPLLLPSLILSSAAGVSASFGEMLLLVAMYFHSNQLSAIIELVCSTLGMKVSLSHQLSSTRAAY